MSIVGVIGLPGSGKTTLLAKAAYNWLHGRSFLGIPARSKVFTNFECPGCYKLDFDCLGLYNFHDANMLIDEIMLLADNRNFKTFPEHLKAFFCLHRRSELGICWCSQRWDCDAKIRALTERYYLLKDSIIPGVSFIKPIVHNMGVSRSKLDDSFTIGAPITWKILFRPYYYTLFDSFESKLHTLPEPKLKLWGSGDLPKLSPLVLFRWLRAELHKPKNQQSPAVVELKKKSS